MIHDKPAKADSMLMNHRGYPSNAQQYDSRLRPPVEDRELEIDQRNGMKKYIASDGEGFDTSTACIRKHLEKCIELGRRESRQLPRYLLAQS